MAGRDPVAAAFRVVGGVGGTRARLEDLERAVVALREAARAVRAASFHLTRGREVCRVALPYAPVQAQLAVVALSDCVDGPRGARAAADELDDLADRLRSAAEGYAEAESRAHRLLRLAATGTGSFLGEHPHLAVAAGALTTVTGIHLVRGAVWRSLLLRRPDPVLQTLVTAGRNPASLVSEGRGELGAIAIASFARALPPGTRPPSLAAPQEDARLITGALPPEPPTGLLERLRPPQLPRPTTLAGVLDNVARTYGDTTASGLDGTAEGTISIQRLDRPDGTRAWVVSIPGTQDAGLGDGAVPMDLRTNLELMGARPGVIGDAMTGAVLDAMRSVGVRGDEPVVLAGHSQGGMVAVSVASAAAGLYSVRAVVTAGSPDTSVRVPAGVRQLNFRHDGDAVPQSDGTGHIDHPDVTTVVRLDPPTGTGPAQLMAAHDVSEYVTTAAEAEAVLAADPSFATARAAVADVLGPDGTTALTRQFQATRDPLLYGTDQVTGLPVPPRLTPVGGGYPAPPTGTRPTW